MPMQTVTFDSDKFQLVPKEPTEEMLESAATWEDFSVTYQQARAIYKECLLVADGK